MRYVVVGAGAVGGMIAARLHQSGRDVVAIARGDHLAAMTARGLTLKTPTETVVVAVPVVATVDKVDFLPDDVVILAVKSQDTLGLVRQMETRAPSSVAVVCAQNGVENERVALRHFPNVYGMCVLSPAGHLEPGVVEVHCAPSSGVLDLGRYPRGVDQTATAIAADLTASTFYSAALEDIMTIKWGKLMGNINNAIQALCGPDHPAPELTGLVRAEAVAVLAAHGVDTDAARRAVQARAPRDEYQPVPGGERSGGSSWQSLRRGSGDIEVDYLNGEISLMGRLAGIPTPANDLVQERANEAARARRAPGSATEASLLAALTGQSDRTPSR